jgi:hypothetical protein
MLLATALGTLALATPRARTCSMDAVRNTLTVAELAARQQTAVLLAEHWPAAAAQLGSDLACDAVETRPSEIHGVGLFAQRDLAAGSLVALHPVHRILQVQPCGRMAGALADESDGAYFGPSLPREAQEAYRQIYCHVDPRRPTVFYADANPQRPDLSGWLAHRVNDGACVARPADEEALVAYYEASNARRNVCAVALCAPLVGLVTTADVASGDELCATYGHKYWLRSEVAAPTGPQAERLTSLANNVAREADLWQVATDKRLAKQLAALEAYLEAEAASDVEPVEPAKRKS